MRGVRFQCPRLKSVQPSSRVGIETRPLLPRRHTIPTCKAGEKATGYITILEMIRMHPVYGLHNDSRLEFIPEFLGPGATDVNNSPTFILRIRIRQLNAARH